jgi:NlpC/P60 family protein
MNPRITGAVPVCFLLFTADAVAQDVIDVAASLIGRPYVWGAEGPNSFDCSGLTQYVYQQFGIELPRRAISQSRFGDAAGRRFRRGDLLFFSTDARKSEVTHVGLYEGDGVMIDASKRHGRVRRDDLSDQYWVERFMFARRVDDGPSTSRVRSDRRDGDEAAPPRASDAKRQATIRVLRGVADILFDNMRR